MWFAQRACAVAARFAQRLCRGDDASSRLDGERVRLVFKEFSVAMVNHIFEEQRASRARGERNMKRNYMLYCKYMNAYT